MTPFDSPVDAKLSESANLHCNVLKSETLLMLVCHIWHYKIYKELYVVLHVKKFQPPAAGK